jgi:hypothetical protein
VLIGIGSAFVERVIGVDAGSSLADTELFPQAVAEAGGMSSSGITWLDFNGLQRALEASMGDLDAGAMASYEADVAPWLEPLHYFLVVSRVDGDQVRTESVLVATSVIE